MQVSDKATISNEKKGTNVSSQW